MNNVSDLAEFMKKKNDADALKVISSGVLMQSLKEITQEINAVARKTAALANDYHITVNEVYDAGVMGLYEALPEELMLLDNLLSIHTRNLVIMSQNVRKKCSTLKYTKDVVQRFADHRNAFIESEKNNQDRYVNRFSNSVLELLEQSEAAEGEKE